MAKKVSEFEVTILNWDKFNPRKDVKNNRWFRLDHTLFEHPDFMNFHPVEILFWIYLLTIASKQNRFLFLFYPKHAEVVARIKYKYQISGLEKLNKIKAITYKHVTQTLQERDVDVPPETRGRNADVTLRNDTIRNDTEQKKKTPGQEEKNAAVVELPELAVLWNEKADAKLSRITEMSKSSRRRKKVESVWDKKPDPAYWTTVLLKMNATPFCLGAGDRGWKVDLEWLVSGDNAAKVLEGKYDDKQKMNGLHPKGAALHQSNIEFASQFLQPGVTDETAS